MRVKGTAVKTTRDFVNEKFKTRYNEWINHLPEDSKKLYSGIIEFGNWFPVTTQWIR